MAKSWNIFDLTSTRQELRSFQIRAIDARVVCFWWPKLINWCFLRGPSQHNWTRFRYLQIMGSVIHSYPMITFRTLQACLLQHLAARPGRISFLGRYYWSAVPKEVWWQQRASILCGSTDLPVVWVHGWAPDPLSWILVWWRKLEKFEEELLFRYFRCHEIIWNQTWMLWCDYLWFWYDLSTCFNLTFNPFQVGPSNLAGTRSKYLQMTNAGFDNYFAWIFSTLYNIHANHAVTIFMTL